MYGITKQLSVGYYLDLTLKNICSKRNFYISSAAHFDAFASISGRLVFKRKSFKTFMAMIQKFIVIICCAKVVLNNEL
jgi:hypothetical protein